MIAGCAGCSVTELVSWRSGLTGYQANTGAEIFLAGGLAFTSCADGLLRCKLSRRGKCWYGVLCGQSGEMEGGCS